MVKDPFILGVIPARGGSQRIKKKNIAPFAGKPLLAWTIEAAQRSGFFSDIVVSTEDESIARTAKEYGASVPFLRNHFADSQSPVSLATCESVSRYEEVTGRAVTHVIQLMPTCPFRTAEDIKNAYSAFLETSAPAQISCAKHMGLNPWWSVTLDKYNFPQSVFPDTMKSNSQDLPELFCPSGAIWIAEKGIFLQNKTFYIHKHIFYPISWLSAFDIDTPEELDMAERIMLGMQAQLAVCG